MTTEQTTQSQRVALAEKAASNLLDSVQFDLPPVDAHRIAIQSNLDVTFRQFDAELSDWASFLDARGSRGNIIISADLSQDYKNFAIAYELGRNIFFHDKIRRDTGVIYGRKFQTKIRKDDEDDELLILFASFLLVPHSFIKYLLTIDESYFMVPKELLEVRYGAHRIAA